MNIIKKIRRSFSNLRLRERMLFFYIIGGVLPLGIADVYTYVSVRSVMISQAKEREKEELSLLADSIEESMEVIEQVSKRLYFDESIEHIAFTEYGNYEDILEDYRNYDTIESYVKYYYQEISGITIYMNNSTISNNEYFVYADTSVRGDEQYIRTVNLSGSPYWSYHYDSMNRKYSLNLSRMLYTKEMEKVGVVSINMQNKRTELPITERETATMLIYNNTMVLHCNDSSVDTDEVMALLLKYDEDSFSDKVNYNGEDYLLSFVRIVPDYSENFFTVASICPYQEIVASATRAAFGNLIPTSVCMAAALGLILVFSNSFSRRVNTFKQEMHRAAGGDFQIAEQMEGGDEIAELYGDLNSMIRDIQGLMQTVVAEQVQKEQLNTRQKEIEFKMLASQINPHFLYNTLETIRMRARVKKETEIEELVKMLAKLLRYNIQVSGSLQRLSDEMQFVEYYLKIQDYRFHDRIRSEIRYEDDVAPKLYVMPLLIQPIVENAFSHGLKAKESGGLIVVSARAERTALVVTVKDNGCGMTAEQLKKVRESLEDYENLDRTHIGIANVSQRIRLRYGADYGVSIESAPGEGTTVTIRLPALADADAPDNPADVPRAPEGGKTPKEDGNV